MTAGIELLTVDDIAIIYKVTARTARENITKTPGFPAVAPGSTPRHPRWLASDVQAFVTRKVQQAPHKSRTSSASN